MSDTDASLKIKTARSVKWNAIDRLSSQVLYAVTGIVLANKLSDVDFGLVGVILIFQSFASLLVDSGFSYALIQRKAPTRLDYSTVLWFNMGIAVLLYCVLWASAPLIARCFGDDPRLVPLSRVMFMTFILNASSIVQVNRLTKLMDVRPVAIANFVALGLSGAVGIVMACTGYGPWAIVWQSITNSGLKSAILWVTTRWMPLLQFSWVSLRSFVSVGSSMMLTSLLNTIFLNIFSFFIGLRGGLASLGYYTQSDKWSKMGIMSILQTLTSSFLPALSAVQDEAERLRRLCSKMNRMTSYIIFPAMVGLAIMAAPIFHILFGQKWDLSIPLFQILLIRGIFTIFTGVYNNYILSVGRSRLIVAMEAVKDGTSLLALIITLPYLAMEIGTDIVYGVRIMLYGQLIAAAIAWAVTLVTACRATGTTVWSFIRDMLPYMALTAVISPALMGIGALGLHPVATLSMQVMAGAAAYLGCNWALRSRIQADVVAFVLGKMKK